MRIGEILLQQQSVEWEALALAIDDHRSARMRLCSYLVWKGALDFDAASRALGQKLGVAAALRKHLEHRDRELAALIPFQVARRRVLLPIGRLGNGALVVVARDPSPALATALERVVGPLVLAVAPAKYLERMVANAYPRGVSGEIEVPIEVDDADELSDSDLLLAADDDAIDDVSELLDDDDDEHRDDFDLDIEVGPAKLRSKPLPVEIKPVVKRATTKGGSPARDSLDATIAALRDIDELEWLLDAVMTYLRSRWRSAVLFDVEGKRAKGIRGHGTKLGAAAVGKLVLPLGETSTVQLARDEQRVVDSAPDEPGPAQATLVAALETTGTPVAAPLLRGETVTHVLVVGDPLHGDAEDTAADLGLLAEAMQNALAAL